MKTFKILKMAAAGAAMLAAANGAQACDVWRDEILKVPRGICNLTIDAKAPKVVETFVGHMRWTPPFKMPDLTIDKYKFEYLNGQLWVYADVENLGSQNASATNLGVTIEVRDSISLALISSTVPTPLPAVPVVGAGLTERVYLAIVNVDNSMADRDVLVAGSVDQVTVVQPVRGNIIESNETNNGLIHMCRLYGPNPDTSVQTCN